MHTTKISVGNRSGNSGYEETIDSPATPEAIANSTSQELQNRVRQRVALVEGNTPHLSEETLSLLRDRLRIVAILLLAIFGVFLLRSLLNWEEYATGPAAPVFIAHVAVTALLALVTQRLCTSCKFFLSHLRLVEFLIIGGSAAFLAFFHYYKLTLSAAAEPVAYLPNITPGWIILVFSYAIFVPNTWQRAAAVLGLLGVAPLAVWGIAYLRSAEFAEMAASSGFTQELFTDFLIMCSTVVAATVGVATIGTLRREVFVARQLGQYRLKQLLGSGGMGEVYLAEHQMMKRPCAVKIIRPEKAGNPQVLARFEREVRATAKLSHWNSIDIFDYGRTSDGIFYYVMEYLPGHNVAELVSMHGPLPAERVVYLMQQVCDALAEAHSQGMVHRDIKPENIFCAFRGGLFDVAKILDFGLAKPITENQNVELTQEGSITGSPMYMSPEQATGSDQLDARSDIYSLGAVMYLMVTGQAPFTYNQPLKILVAHASEAPRPPSELNPTVPQELEDVILRCLEKDPEDRIQDTATLHRLLGEIPNQSPWSRADAARWWTDYGCPKRKALAAAAVDMAAC